MEGETKKPYHCSICGKDFALNVTFKAHTVLHERETPYKCGWCGDVFLKNSLALKDHMRQHLDKWESSKKNESVSEQTSEEVNKTCKHCNKNLSSSYSLERHLRTHTGEKPFQCGVCMKRYISRESVKIHIQKRHSGNEPSYICEFCGEKFVSKSSLARHSIKHKNEVEYKCDVCGKIFRSKKVLGNHKRVHMDEMARKSRLNSDMSKCSVYANPIEENVVTATTEKKYTCSSCGKHLLSHRSVLNHMLMHAETALHSCKVCGIAFSNTTNLVQHAESHTNYDTATDSRNVICEAIQSREKITLYIKNEYSGSKVNNEKKVFMLEEKGFHYDPKAYRANWRNKHSDGYKRDDVMVIDEDVVIDVEEVIIADKEESPMEPSVMLDPLM